jgi:hypothetical protein
MIVAGFALATAGCKPATETTTAEITPVPTAAPTAEETPELSPRNDVKIVVIRPGMPNPIAEPESQPLRAERQIIIWVLAGNGSIEGIQFAKSPFPGGEQPKCARRFCWTSGPPESQYIGQNFPYEVTAAFLGETVTSDPNVEVIP